MKTRNLTGDFDYFAAFALTNEEMIAIRGGNSDGGDEPVMVPPPPPIKY